MNLFADLSQSISSLRQAITEKRCFPHIENLEHSAASLRDRINDELATSSEPVALDKDLMLALDSWYKFDNQLNLEKLKDEYRAYHLNKFNVTP